LCREIAATAILAGLCALSHRENQIVDVLAQSDENRAHCSDSNGQQWPQPSYLMYAPIYYFKFKFYSLFLLLFLFSLFILFIIIIFFFGVNW
jgi:hypothetical protein